MQNYIKSHEIPLNFAFEKINRDIMTLEKNAKQKIK